jgi:hypothetical protein
MLIQPAFQATTIRMARPHESLDREPEKTMLL